jgi:hypothetical protein
VQALGGDKGKPLREVKPDLAAEQAPRSRTRAIGPVDTMSEDISKELMILQQDPYPPEARPSPIPQTCDEA